MIGYVERIVPSYDNAESIVSLRRRNLLDAGLSPEDTKKFADLSNPIHIEHQLAKLEAFPNKHLGLVALNSCRLVGYIEHIDWKYENEMPYFNAVEKMAYRALINCGIDRAKNKPFGIAELCVAGNDREKASLADSLLTKAIELAEPREMIIESCMDAETVVALYQNGFEPTGRFATVNGVYKQLLYRPPLNRNHINANLSDFVKTQNHLSAWV